MRRFGGSVSDMRAAVASLDALVASRSSAAAELAELTAWRARQRAARRASSPPAPLVSAPETALEAWRHEQARRFIRS